MRVRKIFLNILVDLEKRKSFFDNQVIGGVGILD